jgi:siroheme synthase-like protein
MAEPTPSAPVHASYPVSLDVRGRPCLVVGGGPVAARKARALLACGALVTVIAPDLCADMEGLSPLTLERHPYAAGDASGFRLVLTATGDAEVDGSVYRDADAAGIWVNSADDLAHCSLTLPSVHRDGAVSVAVSTGGASPALASWLRGQLAAQIGGGLDDLAQVLAAARARVKESGLRTDEIDWTGLLDGALPELVRQGRMDEAQALIDGAIEAAD